MANIAKLGFTAIAKMGYRLGMSSKITYLVTLAEVMGEHIGVTHWALSMRIFGKGDFFHNFKSGARKGLDVNTWFRTMHWFDENWPSDLEWPAEIPRLNAAKGDAA